MWKFETDPNDLVFIPQVGERIVYIAHAFSIWRSKNNNHSQTLHSSNLTLTVIFDDDPKEYVIPFVPNTYPNYIIDEDLFQASMSTDFIVGSEYSFLHQDELYTSPLEAILQKSDKFETLKFKVKNKYNSFKLQWNILEV